MATKKRKAAKAQLKVWRPSGFSGVEVERFDNARDLVLEPALLTAHELTVVYGGAAQLHYANQDYRFTRAQGLFLAQHAGEVLAGIGGTREPVSVWTLRLFPEVLTRLKAEFALSDAPIYFPEMMVSADLNDTLAGLTSDVVRSFSEKTSQLERESKLFALLYATLKTSSSAPPVDLKLGNEHRATALVKEVLNTNSEAEHSLDDLAQLTQLSKVYLYEVFKREVGLSPAEYQRSLRLGRAKHLLAEGEPIAQVALTTGFSDQSHLTRVFKRYVKTTPGKFQRYSLKT